MRNIGIWAFAYCTDLSQLTLSEGLESIGESAFTQCWSLPSVIIPSTVTTIGDSAFEECRALTAAVFRDSPPTFGDNISNNHADGFLIIYPTGDKRAEWERETDPNYDAEAQTYCNYDAQSGVLVSFVTNHDSLELEPQRVEYDSLATTPDTPIDPDRLYEFSGWYSDDGCTNLFNFEDTPITENTTLYTKWLSMTNLSFREAL